MPILLPLFGYEYFAQEAKEQTGKVNIHTFPDGESLVQIQDNIQDQEVIFVTSLNHPDEKILPLIFAAQIARDLGATRVGLVCPYLAYMRQDTVFNPGEGVSSVYFARLLSSHFDWLSTIDPHLHRWHDLSQIYTIPAQSLHAIKPISAWIERSVELPLLIGPDSESTQWVKEIADTIQAPYLILEKHRRGDNQVEISAPHSEQFKHHTPVLVDDIISSAMTMIETIRHLKRLGMNAPVCIGVHAVFAPDAYEKLLAAGPEKVVTSNTIPHPSNQINVSSLMWDEIFPS